MSGQNLASIMVVEDEIIVRNDIQKTLERKGYSIAAVSNTGQQAINLAEEHQPDLILMDIHLKGDMNGIETSKKIISKFNIPVIYLTAYSDPETLRKAKETNHHGYILKPFNEQQLIASIEGTLRIQMQQVDNSLNAPLDILEELSNGYILWNISENVVHFSENWLATLGIKDNGLGEITINSWFDRVHPDDKENFFQCMEVCRGDSNPKLIEIEYRIKTKDDLWLWVYFKGVMYMGSDNLPAELAGMHIDVNTRRVAEDSLIDYAHNDYITGIPSRTAFLYKLNQLFLQKERKTKEEQDNFVVFLVGLTKLESISQIYGYAKRDDLFRQVAKNIADGLSEEKNKTIYLWDSGTFIVLVEKSLDKKNISSMSEKIRKSINRSGVHFSEKYNLGVSINVCARSKDYQSLQDMLSSF